MRKTGVMGATTAIAAQQLDLLRGLADAQTPRAIAAEIVRLCQSDPACNAARLLWGFEGAREPECEPASQPGVDGMALARTVAAHKGPVFLAEGQRIALRLVDITPAVLLLEFDPQVEGHR
ncbi:MAG TPA: hypothetical protein VK660_10030, partial [Xanthomonadaceae bacterium]|nr:hypothetical protein [Xanthomonadaceae bacterium]